MIDPTSQKIIYEQRERELLNVIELKRRIAEMGAYSMSQPPWYVRVEEKLFHLIWRKPVVEPCDPSVDPCCVS